METSLTNNVMVGVGIADYQHLKSLPRAVADVEELATLLGQDGFSTVTSFDEKREEVVRKLTTTLLPAKLATSGTALVLYWSGHAAQNQATGTLRLFTVENSEGDPDALVVTSDQLAEIAAQSGASQLLIVIDTCYSGQAVLDAARIVDSIQRKGLDQDRRWVGIVAACRNYEKAVDGALAAKLKELLTHGPKDQKLRLRWSAYQAGLRGDDLLDALVKEWEGELQTPTTLGKGDPWLILPNPLFQSDFPEHVVEHLLWAARGASPNETGIWFVGRKKPLREIVAWLGARKPGLCVVTGSAGSGKSAVAGRIVSLSNAAERGEIFKAQGPPDADLDPGEGSIDMHVQVRGMNLDRCVEVLARGFGVIGAGAAPNHHDVLAWASARESPPVIVIDGLDEAGEEGFEIATELLAPLAQYAQVLVASREVPRGDGEPTLLGSLGPAALHVNLDADPGGNDSDVHEYVISRLSKPDGEPIDDRMQGDLVAEEVVRLTRADDGREGPFLLARIITAQLIAGPVDTSKEDWQGRLAGTVEEALDQDLETGQPLKRGDAELPQAGHELLAALAYSYGSGFPADDIWPAAATALSASETRYERLDAFWALSEHGRYVTASSQNGQAVYRLHERLASGLKLSTEQALPVDGERPEAVVAKAILAAYEQFLELDNAARDHPYLWFYAWRHAADAGPEGIEGLERLVERDSTLLPDLAMALSYISDRQSEAALHVEAVPPAERALAIYEELAKENRGFLASLGATLNDLSARYSEVGRQPEAAGLAERAVEIYEGLAKENDGFLPDLASALNNLGACYSEIGKQPEAVAPTERAVEIYERLAKEHPAALADLASSLSNLGSHLGAVGKRNEAVAPSERAVELYEGLVEEGVNLLPSLGSALSNLGVCYGGVGRRTDAVRPTERSVEIYAALAEENPGFRYDLASSLNNLGICYSQVGRRGDAVEPTERAVELYEALAQTNPGFLPPLATALNNLGVRYSEVGRHIDAVEPTQRSVEIREALAKDNPGILQDLSGALNNLGNRLARVGRHAEAVEPTERAVKIREELAKTNMGILPELAGSLNNLGIRYGDVGRHVEAIAPTERAVRIREKLVEENPGFLNELASSLNNLGNRYGDVRRHSEAIAPTERAVGIYEGLAEENDGFVSDLAMALNNLGIHYSEVERFSDALKPTSRAVGIYEELAKENDGFLPQLAGALNSLGVRFGSLKRPSEAVEPGERAVEIYDALAKDNPGFLPDLAGALNNLGNRYTDVDRAVDALPPSERAVEIYEGLAEKNPGFLSDLAMALNNLATRYHQSGEREKAERLWSQALERFDSNPNAAVVLRLTRQRGSDELDAIVGDLVEAIELDPGDDTRLTAEIHGVCRTNRSLDPERFDALWTATFDELPGWLLLDAETRAVTSDWLDTPNWVASRDFLIEHEETLLSERGRSALAEIQLLNPGNPLVARQVELIETAQREGIDAAYKDLLAGEVVVDWAALADPEESRRFLLEHSEELLQPGAVGLLAERGEGVASTFLDLALNSSVERAFELRENPDARADAMAAAVVAGEFRLLIAMASYCALTAADRAQRAVAATYLSIALVTTDAADRALAILGDLDTPAPGPLIALITAAISAHPAHAGGFARLIEALNKPALPSGDAAEGEQTD